MTNSVPEWYRGRSILVTGATGFMGKVLVEKLLRSCPDIKAIYILIRPKRGKDPLQRLEDFVNAPVFDKIRDENEKLFEKIHCLSGDVTQKNLNLSNTDLILLQNTINVVFHMAANVRFDQPLKSALFMNTGGTLNMLEVAETLKNLQSFVHVSTSFCHCDETELEEKPYKAPHNPRQILKMVQWMDEGILKKITPDLLKGAPNTYAYTKCLTEQLVAEYSEKMPIAIARPSIVIASWKEPIPGWIENLNGPTGLLVGAGKGVIRSMHCKPENTADLMPVDVAINSIILVGWQVGNNKSLNQEPYVVNVCSGKDNVIAWGDALEIGKKHFYQNPFTICLWYPNGSIKSNYYVHMISVILFHLIPAYFIDFLLFLFGQKTFLVQTQKRIQNGLEVLQYYTIRNWYFHNEKTKKIWSSLNEQDKQTFYVDISELNWDKYLLDYVLGARKYCVHEEPHTIPRARKILRRLYYLDCLKNAVFFAFIFWLFWHYAQIILSSFGNYIEQSTVGVVQIRK